MENFEHFLVNCTIFPQGLPAPEIWPLWLFVNVVSYDELITHAKYY